MSWGEGMQSKQKPQWAIFKKSHQMNQQQSGKSIGNGCSLSLSLSQQNGPGQQQQHLFVTTNKTNTPKQICKRAHLHMEKPPFAADSLMLMPSWRCVGGWWFLWLSDKYSNSTHQDFFFYFLCKLLPVFHLHT